MTRSPAPEWRGALRASFANTGERQVIIFLACWTFAVNLSAPFYTVYLLERVELRMVWILVLVALWPVLGRIDDPVTRLVLFAVAHAVAGLATGGVTLGTTTLALEVAPREQAAGFLAINATLSGLAAGVGPLLGGALSTWLHASGVELELRWFHDASRGAMLPVELRGLDFLFVASVILGLYAIHRLLALPEGGRGVTRRAMAALAQELQLRARTPVRMLTTVPGLRGVVELPYRLGGRFTRHGGGAEPRAGG
jgi:MFS family permease